MARRWDGLGLFVHDGRVRAERVIGAVESGGRLRRGARKGRWIMIASELVVTVWEDFWSKMSDWR